MLYSKKTSANLVLKKDYHYYKKSNAEKYFSNLYNYLFYFRGR